jgi:hypothetical protein
MGYEAIKIQVGLITESADGWTGSVKGNYIRSPGLTSTVNAISITNAKNVAFNNNTILEGSGTLTRGILVAGDGSTNCRAFNNLITGAAASDVEFTGGSGHSQDNTGRTSATTAELENSLDSINTDAAKILGYMVLNSSTGKTVFAAGSGDFDVWHDYASNTVHTPVTAVSPTVAALSLSTNNAAIS